MGRTLWSCGLIHHDRKVEGSNLAAAKNLFQIKSTKISLRKSEQTKKGTLSLIESVRAAEMKRIQEEKEKEVEASFEVSILCGGTI